MKTGLTREIRLQIKLAKGELKELDDFRFDHRIPSRAAAVRELLRLGLSSGAGVEDARSRPPQGLHGGHR